MLHMESIIDNCCYEPILIMSNVEVFEMKGYFDFLQQEYDIRYKFITHISK